MLITTSKDKYMKIWTKEGTMKASINLNHPLPMDWNVTLKKQKNTLKKALYALKILDIIAQRHNNWFDFSKDKNININEYLQRIYEFKYQTGENFYITG
jgi:hypothetical protein